MKSAGCYWVYILQCDNNTYYTGYTSDLSRRYQEHLNGSSKCKYTRSFKPLCIAQSWQINGDKAVAMQIEIAIKKMKKKDKEKLILNPLLLAQAFPQVFISV